MLLLAGCSLGAEHCRCYSVLHLCRCAACIYMLCRKRSGRLASTGARCGAPVVTGRNQLHVGDAVGLHLVLWRV